jgi:hypothetical protein
MLPVEPLGGRGDDLPGKVAAEVANGQLLFA